MEMKPSKYVFLALDNDIMYSVLEQKKLVKLTDYNIN